MNSKPLLLALSFSAFWAQAQTPIPTPNFVATNTITLPQGALPSDVAAAQLDGDSNPDLAVAERGLSDVRVFRQTTQGSFAPGVAYPSGPGPTGVLAIGMDAPNYLIDDLAVVAGRTVTTFRNANDGQGTLLPQPPSNFGVSNWPPVQPAVAAGYMDRDGFLDFVYTWDNPTMSYVGCLRHTGGTTFTNGGSFLQSGLPSTCVTLADVTGDAFLDVLVNRPATNQIRIYPHNGFGAWVNTSNPRDLSTGGTQPVGIAAADVSGDQRVDLAVANAGNNTVGLLLNVTPLQYAAPVTFAQSAAPRQVLLLDLNGDFLVDMVTITADAQLHLWANTGLQGIDRFRLVQSLPTGPDPVVLKSLNVIGDSTPELVVACAGDNTVRVWRNASRPLSTARPQLAGLEVYPNPAAGRVTVRRPAALAAEPLTATFLDALGRVLARQTVPANGELRVDQLPRGLCLLRLESQRGSSTHRLVLQ